MEGMGALWHPTLRDMKRYNGGLPQQPQQARLPQGYDMMSKQVTGVMTKAWACLCVNRDVAFDTTPWHLY